jgi:hypothetical protein
MILRYHNKIHCSEFNLNPGQYCRVGSVFENLSLGSCDVLEWFYIKFNAFVIKYSVLTASSKGMFVFAALQHWH